MKRKYLKYLVVFLIVSYVATEIHAYILSRPVKLDYEFQKCDFSMEVGTHCLDANEHVIKSFDNKLLANSDEKDKYSWYEAMEFCERKGDGWRLPSKEEMEKIYKKRKELSSNFCYFSRKYCAYWTSTEASIDGGSKGNAYITKRGSNMQPKGNLWRVRCIKNF